jgi:pyridoxamine 5'-phosphate oxidase
MVLLKGMDDGRFIFFTNYKSKKGKQLEINPNVSLLFFWPELERQVRIEGVVEMLPGVDSDKYFDSRPLESRIGAIASPQSQVITGREEIEDSFYRVAELFTTSKITRPDYWGGYSIFPECIEFWQGRPGRLHDRIQYRRADDQNWIQERLAP